MDMGSITVEQYKKAVSALSDAQKIVLKTLYYFPNSSATAKELAAALDYSGFQAANRQIGQIGKAIALYLNIKLPEYYGKKGNQPAYYLAIGEYYKDSGWNMWYELQKALEDLNLVSSNVDILNEKLPTEIDSTESGKLYKEGKVIEVLVNRYERNRGAKEECLKIHGDKCYICDFDFGEKYGMIAEGFIHVHHKLPLSEIGHEYKVDPVNDLIPVCANCHSVLHLTNPAMDVEELKNRIKKIEL